MTRPPQYIDYQFPFPIADAYRAAPLVRVASEAELRATPVVDPVFHDQVSCSELRDRDRDCWHALAATYPPKFAFTLTTAQRQHAAAARAVCRRRAAPLLNTCRVGSVRVG